MGATTLSCFYDDFHKGLATLNLENGDKTGPAVLATPYPHYAESAKHDRSTLVPLVLEKEVDMYITFSTGRNLCQF